MDNTNPPARSVFLLGRLQVMEHGKPLSIPGGKVSDLLAFLEHLESERGNTAATRNARLAAVHAFARFT